MFAAAVALSGLMGAAPSALGQETGTFTKFINFTYDYTTIELGDFEAFGGPINGTLTVLESSGGPFAAGESSLLSCLVYGKRGDEGVSLEAPCTITGPSGDRWFMTATRDAGDVAAGGGGQGVWTILGGTGAFAGVTGSCPYTAEYLDDTWLVNSADCEWSKE